MKFDIKSRRMSLRDSSEQWKKLTKS